MLIRPMTAGDLAAVQSIQEACRGEAAQWNPADYLQHRATVLEVDDAVRAFLVIREIVPKLECEILNLAVHPAWRRRGLARALLVPAIQNFPACWLEVRASDTAARNFYKKQGFQEALVRRNYYSQPDEDGIVMRR